MKTPPPRKHGPYSQVFVEHKLPTGQILYLPYVDDLTDTELQQAMDYWIDQQDYEYCQHLATEADRRHLKLKT